MAKWIIVFLLYSVFRINAYNAEFKNILAKSTSETIKYVIFDTDMGGDDAWALQFVLKSEKECQNVKVLAITTTFGNSDVTNAIKNTYRILDGLNRTDVSLSISDFFCSIFEHFLSLYRFRYIKVLQRASSRST